MSNHPRKIYIDTKYKTKNSNNNSDFSIELPETILLPEKCYAYLDEICIPHSFYTIESGINNKFYIHISNNNANVNLRPMEYYVITIPSKTYTGASLASAINNELTSVLQGTLYGGQLVATYVADTQSITIHTLHADMTFKILTENDIATKLDDTWIVYQNNNYDPKNASDLNGEILKLTEGNSPYYNYNNAFTSNFDNLNSIRNLYITSSNLGNFNSIGANGERTILRKVPVDSDFNYMIFNNQITGLDYINVSKQTLKTINFKIQTVDGKVVPLHGANVSFSIIFDVKE